MSEFEQMVTALVKPGDKIIEALSPAKAHLMHMAVGISGEVTGELLDEIYSADMLGRPIDKDNIIEELGDIEFFMEGLRQGAGITRVECQMAYRHDEPIAVVPLIGLNVISGQLLDLIKKHVIYGKELDRAGVVERLGAMDFYLKQIYAEFYITREHALEKNVEKLLKGKNARYAAGAYSDKAAQDRADKQ